MGYCKPLDTSKAHPKDQLQSPFLDLKEIDLICYFIPMKILPIPKKPSLVQLVTLLVLFDLAISLDQITKILAVNSLSSPLVFTPWLRFVLERNTGIAFSIAIPYYLLIILNILIFGSILYYLVLKLDFEKKLSLITLALLSAGALGNLADRLRLGSVVDFISVGNFPVFNLADSYITVSVFLLLLFYDKIKRPNNVYSHGGEQSKPKSIRPEL